MSTPISADAEERSQVDPADPGGYADAPEDPFAGKTTARVVGERLVKDKVALVCMIIVAFFVLVAVFAGVLSRAFGVSLEIQSPSELLDFTAGGLPKDGPPNHGFDPDHPFGVAPRTANDNLAYWLYGARTSLSVAGMATLLATLIGVGVGVVAGFFGGWVDRVLSFVIDFFLTVPFLLAALVIAPIITERFAITPELYERVQFWSLIGVLSFFGWMPVARLIRGEVLSLREREFIQAARVLGMPTRRVMVRELLPNLTAPIVVSVSLMLPTFVAAEAALAYLGIGITEGATWGQTILDATDYFQVYPLFLWQPLLGIVVLVIALNLLGDSIRDAVDPKSRR